MANGRLTLIAGTLLIIGCSLSSAAIVPESRILQGEDANVGQFPYGASLRLDSAHVAGAVIIDSLHLLAPAHPISNSGNTAVDARRVSVRVGSTNQYSGGQIIDVSSITIHPSYGNFLHNLAIIKLSEPLTYSSKIAAIDLPGANEEVAVGTEVTVAGWGIVDETGEAPYKLQHGKLSVMSSPDCEYEAGYGYVSVLCLKHAVGQGICRGDEGAGVVANNKLVGIASFAFGNCGTKYPDVASRVSYYHDWITTTIEA